MSEFFESEVSSLPDSLETLMLTIPSGCGPETLIPLLRGGFVSLIPEIGSGFSAIPTDEWVAEIENHRSFRNIDDRWILIEGFDNVLEAPCRDRRVFVDVLRAFAAIPSFGVIAGITVERAEPIAALLELLEGPDEVEEAKDAEDAEDAVEAEEVSEGSEDTENVFGEIEEVIREAAEIEKAAEVEEAAEAEQTTEAAKAPERRKALEESRHSGLWTVACVVLGLVLAAVGIAHFSKFNDGGMIAPSGPAERDPEPSPAASGPGSEPPKPDRSSAKSVPEVVVESVDSASLAGAQETIPPEPEVPAEPKLAEKFIGSFEPTHSREGWIHQPEDEVPEQETLYLVAEAYCFGHGVEQDLEQGISLLQEANGKGSEKAANLLATCYARGFGVDQDYGESHQLYETAIDRGSIHAYGNLGVLYLRGLGVESDPAKALNLFLKGAEQGDSVAALFAAKCFEDGIGNADQKPNQELAVYYYIEAARGGQEEAIAWCRERNLLSQVNSLDEPSAQ